MASTFEEEMAGFQEEWAEAQENASTATLLPDGDYQARIVESRVERASWGEWQLAIRWEDMGGAGSRWTWDSLEHEVGRSIAAERSKRLGYEGELTGLKAYVEGGGFIDLVCAIKVVTKPGDSKDFTNVYVNRCYGKATEEQLAAAAATSPIDDDDIPF